MDTRILLSEPVELVFIDIYRDGGTIAIGLQDTEKRALSFSVDGCIGSFTPNRVYLNGTFPDGRTAVLIPKGDSREQRIVQLLEGWLDKTFTKEEQADLHGSYGTHQLSELERRGALCLSAVGKIKA
ncbi:MAG: hypothetical protein JXA25_01810 [Anaerolineales bacterium]|nr:hypothetical protein [Anaerolineales bacterium]